MSHKELWEKVFCDTKKYMDFYFREKAQKSIVYSKYEGTDLASMAFFTPYKVMFRGKEYQCPYIVGVATRPESRHQGYMKKILEQGLIDTELTGAPLAFLSPENEKVYESLGFRGAYYRTRIEVQDMKNKWYSAASFSHLEVSTKEKAAEFANAQLHASELDLYRCRSVGYYDLLYKEMKALGGKVIVLRDGTFIKGVAAYVHEDETYEVTEVLCPPEEGQKVMESICAYISPEKHQKVVFSDGYFLGNVTGEGIRMQQMEKPYIMVKMFDETEDVSNLKVYINDIT